MSSMWLLARCGPQSLTFITTKSVWFLSSSDMWDRCDSYPRNLQAFPPLWVASSDRARWWWPVNQNNERTLDAFSRLKGTRRRRVVVTEHNKLTWTPNLPCHRCWPITSPWYCWGCTPLMYYDRFIYITVKAEKHGSSVPQQSSICMWRSGGVSRALTLWSGCRVLLRPDRLARSSGSFGTRVLCFLFRSFSLSHQEIFVPSRCQYIPFITDL